MNVKMSINESSSHLSSSEKQFHKTNKQKSCKIKAVKEICLKLETCISIHQIRIDLLTDDHYLFNEKDLCFEIGRMHEYIKEQISLTNKLLSKLEMNNANT